MNNNFRIRMFQVSADGIRPVEESQLDEIGKEVKDEKAFIKVINYSDISRSMRFNPVQLRYLPRLQDCIALSCELMKAAYYADDMTDINSNKRIWFMGAVNLLAAGIHFLTNYEAKPFAADGTPLWPEYYTDTQTGSKRLTRRAFLTKEERDLAEMSKDQGFNITENAVTPALWIGKYSDLPHVLALMNMDYADIFEMLKTDVEAWPLIQPLVSCYDYKLLDMEHSTTMLRILLAPLQMKEACWLLSQDGDDFVMNPEKANLYVTILGSAITDDYDRLLTTAILGKQCKSIALDNSEHPIIKRISNKLFYSFDNDNVMERAAYSAMRQSQTNIENICREICKPKGYLTKI